MLYAIGDFAYELSFKINKVYNIVRKMFGLVYWSLSKLLKSKVKDAISYINDFKHLSMMEVKRKNCDSIMIGHIHTPEIESIGNNAYYNTGDFCESCSYIVEHIEGTLELRYA
jgi:UDP-2,3-diacylglucosamine pyrophosphatase LpxH